MTAIGVFLGGEGRNELGSRSGHPAHQTDTEPGVIETLLRHVQPNGWRVVGARNWAQIRKFRAHGPTPNEQRNVAALALHAREAGARVLAFVRDGDDDSNRAADVSAAVLTHEANGAAPDIIGGVAVPVLEGWLLSLHGESGAERLGKAATIRRFQDRFGFLKETARVVELAQQADLSQIPKDAQSLNAWLLKARSVFMKQVA